MGQSITGHFHSETVNGRTVWHWRGGNVTTITTDLLRAQHSSSCQWYAGQVVRIGAFDLQLLEYVPARDCWIARRLHAGKAVRS